MKSSKISISKSSFIKGIQCHKALFLKKYYPDLEDKIFESLQAIFDKGKGVGILAQELFPGGVDLGSYIPKYYDEAFKQTEKLIESTNGIIYEAGFRKDNLMCFVDILVNKNGKWYAYEVKGSTSVKDIYIWDAAFQYHIIRSSGLELENISIIHLDNKYSKDGSIEVN